MRKEVIVAPQKKKSAAPSPSSSEVDDVARKGQVWKAHGSGLLLTLAMGKDMGARLEQALVLEQRLRDVGPNELFSNFLHHGLVHFEREFPIRAQRASAKKEGKPYVTPPPAGRVERLKERLDNIEQWISRVRDVEKALENGDLASAKALAKESIIRNTKLAEAARNALSLATKALVETKRK
jgi:hypothetical protein